MMLGDLSRSVTVGLGNKLFLLERRAERLEDRIIEREHARDASSLSSRQPTIGIDEEHAGREPSMLARGGRWH